MTNSVFNVPIGERYFEDYVPGSVYEFGSITVGQEEIIEFAKKYDPQVFHIDPDAAQQTVYGGLIASGWHTCALVMRMLVDHFVPRAASLGSPGADELRWLKPVRPGDTLSLRVTILEAKRSQSKPDRGSVRSFIEVLNQNREIVMSRTAIAIYLCRNRA